MVTNERNLMLHCPGLTIPKRSLALLVSVTVAFTASTLAAATPEIHDGQSPQSSTHNSRPAPNILLLLADDLRADTIAAWGNSHIQTPNLDALVREGMSFHANYCAGSNSGAVCVPSRAMLHTGRLWLHVKNDMSNAATLGQILGKNGYATFGTGKWHNRRPSYKKSFQQGRAVFFGGMCDHTKVPLVDFQNGKFINKRIGDKFSSVLFADAAIEFLSSDDRDKEKPFFCYVAFTAAHDPRMPPLEYREKYYKNRPPLPENFLPQHPFDNGHLVLRDENLAAWPRTADVIRDQLAEYYGLITHLDRQIGRIRETLLKTGQADNTYIIFTADHGLALGSHGLLGKQSLYEHSMRSPLIIVGPGIPAGKETDTLTYLYDLLPTICDLTGTPKPENLDGQSLKPLWTGKKAKLRDYVFLPFKDVMRSVRNSRWKLIQYPKINHTQLFDLQHDPHEIKNLANDPQYADVRATMMELLKTAQKNAGDTLPLTTDNPQPKHIDLTGHARKPDRWQPDWIVEKYF